jgi:bifunctional DNA-binding transcriptional regulator/antitoxin component of YhaV-PrlF toxin-antitoxin module
VPRITKGGKYIFGWSRIGEGGKIVIPDEAFDEYGLKADRRVILLSGSRTSGGFGITSKRLLEGSRLGAILKADPEPDGFRVPEGKTVESGGRGYCRLNLEGRNLKLGSEVLKSFGLKVGDRLLAIRGSGFAIGMAVKGPIIEEANEHPEIVEYQDGTIRPES